MRPASRCIKCLWEYVERQVHMRLLMKRIKNHLVISMLAQWLAMVQDAKIALKEQLCASSPLLMRWLKRPMSRTFVGWQELYQTEKRNRQILERMAYRLQNACVVAAFADWNHYVDVMVGERFDALKAATAAALRSCNLTGLLASLQREHGSFHRRNVRWNDFVKTYLEDAVREVTTEEHGEVQSIFERNQRKKARLQAQAQELQGVDLALFLCCHLSHCILGLGLDKIIASHVSTVETPVLTLIVPLSYAAQFATHASS
jgi:hypothetical protein